MQNSVNFDALTAQGLDDYAAMIDQIPVLNHTSRSIEDLMYNMLRWVVNNREEIEDTVNNLAG